MYKKGFTLVELSIVLVIIGLLIGGILAAQSMISTAQTQSVIRRIQQYDVTVTNFQTKYNQLPGDSTLISGLGNNDGILQPGAEIENFWPDLSLGVGLKNNKGQNFQTYTTNVTTMTEANCPVFNIDQNKVGNPCLLVLNYNFQDTYTAYDYGGAKNYYSYAETLPDPSLMSGILPSTVYPLHCTDALAIDKKIDDGQPLHGKALSINCGDLTYVTTSVNPSTDPANTQLYIEINTMGVGK